MRIEHVVSRRALAGGMLLALALGSGLARAALAQEPGPAPEASGALPLSARAGLVRALEILGDERGGSRLQIHALESACDLEASPAGQVVRTRIDVTVFAEDEEAARGVLERAQRVAARRPWRQVPDEVDYRRTRDTFLDLGWRVDGEAERALFFSGAQHRGVLEVEWTTDGLEPAWFTKPFDPVAARELGAVELERQLRSLAVHPDVLLGPVDLRRGAPAELAGGLERRTYELRPASRSRGVPRANLANFLHLLEAGVENGRIVHLAIRPAADGDLWTFEVGLGVWRPRAGS